VARSPRGAGVLASVVNVPLDGTFSRFPGFVAISDLRVRFQEVDDGEV